MNLQAKPMHSTHILLVDDHVNTRFTFRLALESEGYDVDTAAAVAEAIVKIEERYDDLLILDLRLGVESGLELLATARADGIETPVLTEEARRCYRRARGLYAERSFAQGHAVRQKSTPSDPVS